MHRPPLPLDIVRACATTCVVREIRGRDWVLEISPNPGVSDPVLAPMPIPPYRKIHLLGIAAPKRTRGPVSAPSPAEGPGTPDAPKPASEALAGSYGASGVDPRDLF